MNNKGYPLLRKVMKVVFDGIKGKGKVKIPEDPMFIHLKDNCPSPLQYKRILEIMKGRSEMIEFIPKHRRDYRKNEAKQKRGR